MSDILIVEDEPALAEVLRDYLCRDGLAAEVLADGRLALERLRRQPPDLILLDIMLPGLDGLSVLRELRKQSDLPVILVTARVEELDRLIGLELGADDYVCKPYSPREVVARVKTVLRRFQRPALPAGGMLRIEAEAWSASLAGQRLDLTPKEFRLLAALVAKPGRVLSRSQLLDSICEDNLEASERTVDSHMKNLRRKLAQVRPEQELIRSIYGVGFMYEPA